MATAQLQTPSDSTVTKTPQAPVSGNMRSFREMAPVNRLLRHPTAANNLTMERFQRASEEEPAARQGPGVPMDMIRKRPCSPNHQYSCMNEHQIKHVQDRSRPNTVFHKPEHPWISDKRFYMDRYARATRSRTYSHFDGEDVHRYLTIDVYCRPPTNVVERVVHKFGRAPSYYHQRKPHTRTWFGSSHELNQTDVLRDIRPKMLVEYDAKWQGEKQLALRRKGMWPEFSEYTDCYTVRSGKPLGLTRLEKNKLRVAEGKKSQD